MDAVSPHINSLSPGSPGDPVRRGFSVLSPPPLEYWIARSSRATTSMWVARSHAMNCYRFKFQTARHVQRQLRDLAAGYMPEVCSQVPPSSIKGRRECRAPDAPAAARVLVVSTRVSHHGHTGNRPAFPAQWFTAYFELSPVTGLSCHRRRRNCFHRLDASVGASGPHDFTVREPALSSLAPPASTAFRPTSVTIAKRPSGERNGGGYRVIWVFGKSEYFFERD